MKSTYLAITGGIAVLALAVGGFFVWRNRTAVATKFNNAVGAGKGAWGKSMDAARSVSGRVANAAKNLSHTERDPSQVQSPDTPQGNA